MSQSYIVNMESFEINVQEPWFSAIKRKEKTVEGRLVKGKFLDIKVGDVVVVCNGDYKVPCKVEKIRKYTGFREYLELEGLHKCLPGVGSIEEGIAVYREFYSKDMEAKYGVMALQLALVE